MRDAPNHGDCKRFTHFNRIGKREIAWHRITMSPSQSDGVRAASERILPQPQWQSCANWLRLAPPSPPSSRTSGVQNSFSYNQT